MRTYPKKRSRLQQMAACAVLAAVLCICSPLSVPIGPIPISLSAFAVMLTGIVLGWKLGGISVAVYLLLGLCGLPLFSGGNSGLTALPGPTGGYIWSFLPMVALIGLISAIPCKNRWLATLLAFGACICGLVVCYLCGTLQYSLIANIPFGAALGVCVVPFILVDLLKAVCASLLGVTVRLLLKKSGYL